MEFSTTPIDTPNHTRVSIHSHQRVAILLLRQLTDLKVAHKDDLGRKKMSFNHDFLHTTQQRVEQYRTEAKVQHQVKAGTKTSQVQTMPMFNWFTPWFKPRKESKMTTEAFNIDMPQTRKYNV